MDCKCACLNESVVAHWAVAERERESHARPSSSARTAAAGSTACSATCRRAPRALPAWREIQSQSGNAENAVRETHLSCPSGSHEDEHGADVGSRGGEGVRRCQRSWSQPTANEARIARGRLRTGPEADSPLLKCCSVDVVVSGAHRCDHLERGTSCVRIESQKAAGRAREARTGREGKVGERTNLRRGARRRSEKGVKGVQRMSWKVRSSL